MNKIKKIGLFSVSKYQDASILESENFLHLQKIFWEQYSIELVVYEDFFSEIEWVSPQKRAALFTELFLDSCIDIIWAFTGGSASNEILEYLDFSLISQNYKPVIWYSDVTVLIDALYHKTGKINFLGPNVKTLLKDFPGTEITLENLILTLNNTEDVKNIIPYQSFYDSSVREEVLVEWIEVLKHGIGEWIWIWWNLSSISLMIDTDFFPNLEGKILLIEECDEFSIGIIRRNLFRLRLSPGFHKIQGVIFWHINKKCYKDYNFTLKGVLKDVFFDRDIPIILNVWHGHILPVQTFPIGGTYFLDTSTSTYKIQY